ncbi:MAG: thioredoxin domain-containing protein [Actinobacteria bacterium]|nr:thioredoxin domain-containing protein [Actinomycetota bacterium]
MDKKIESIKANHLVSEKSPYLLQHAYNPVNWYPWGKDAFKKAKTEDKPVFLSIGYSTCHWCHVMEKESFEDTEVANILNDTFICIKVDREERPDIDKIYMKYCQMLTGSGGWPLTIIMVPDKKPFFAATYIPKNNKYGITGMLSLIPLIKDLWLNRRSEIIDNSKKIAGLYMSADTQKSGGVFDSSILDITFDRLAQLFDISNGGFGTAPKFPTMHHLYFLLRYHKRTKNEYALNMVEKTINDLRSGGIWDHIGFGFHRYSTDEKWIVPHFEKMLYDQAQISIACIEAYQVTMEEKYKDIAQDIFSYILRDMTSENGGFYSAEDADSEGIEGKFYTWTKNDIKKLFNDKDSGLIIDVFNVGISNLESGSVLYIDKPLNDISAKYGMSLKDLDSFLQSSIKKMCISRNKRIHPFKDDKILTDWNGLMISALSLGARVFNNSSYQNAAVAAADFILDNLITEEGNLLHRYRDGQPAIAANLDDYSFFIMGLIELYQATFNISYLKTAIKLNKYMLENFWDEKAGGFYFTHQNSELNEFAQKDTYDGAIPSGNSIALLNLIKLGRITGDSLFEDKALEVIKAFSGTVNKAPEAYTQFISSYDFLLGPTYEIVIAGDKNSRQVKQILNDINSVFAPNKVVVLKQPGNEGNQLSAIAPYLSSMGMINEKPAIYACSNYTCKAPISEVDGLIKLLTLKH